MDYEDSVEPDAREDEVEATCCICGAVVPIEYATALLLSPPGDEEDDAQQLYCHGHHLRDVFHHSVTLHPAIGGETAPVEEGDEEDPALIKALEAQFARNDSLLDQLRALGAKLDAPSRISVQFVAPSQTHAAQLAAALYDDSYLVIALSPAQADEAGPWSIEATIEQTPATAASDDVTRHLVRLALGFEAEYGGWGIHR